MALDNCSNCPNYCFGNVTPSDCVEYNGDSLKGYLDGLVVTETTPTVSEVVTTDSITSKSIVRNPGAVCGASIVNRTYEYTLSTSQTGSVFGWNTSGVVSALPVGYNVSVTRVRVYGSTVNGKNVIADSSKQSGGINIKTNQYPAAVDVLLRVTSPCGDIDMESTLSLQSPSKTGTYNAVMNVADLNPISGEMVLTDQLDGLEAQVHDISIKVTNLTDPTVTLEQQQAQIDDLNDSVSNASGLSVNYENQESKFTSDLGDTLTAIYAEIGALKTIVTSQEVEIASLRAQIDSINATS